MPLAQLAVLILLPYIGAAVVPWLNVEAIPRVLLITVGWAALLNVFFAGLLMGVSFGNERLSEQVSTDIKLERISSLGVFIMLLCGLLSYSLVSPLVALAIVSIAQLLNIRRMVRSDLWLTLSPGLQSFLGRIMWVSVGCLLMLALSYFRQKGFS